MHIIWVAGILDYFHVTGCKKCFTFQQNTMWCTLILISTLQLPSNFIPTCCFFTPIHSTKIIGKMDTSRFVNLRTQLCNLTFMPMESSKAQTVLFLPRHRPPHCQCVARTSSAMCNKCVGPLFCTVDGKVDNLDGSLCIPHSHTPMQDLGQISLNSANRPKWW